MTTLIYTKNYHRDVVNAIKRVSQGQSSLVTSLNLGGASGPDGGSGLPVGGIYGQLIQSKIAYDSTEAAYQGLTTTSGSLLDNLAHIRYDIDALYEVASGITILVSGVPIASGVTEINFEGNVTVIDEGNSRVTVIIH